MRNTSIHRFHPFLLQHHIMYFTMLLLFTQSSCLVYKKLTVLSLLLRPTVCVWQTRVHDSTVSRYSSLIPAMIFCISGMRCLPRALSTFFSSQSDVPDEMSFGHCRYSSANIATTSMSTCLRTMSRKVGACEREQSGPACVKLTSSKKQKAEVKQSAIVCTGIFPPGIMFFFTNLLNRSPQLYWR